VTCAIVDVRQFVNRLTVQCHALRRFPAHPESEIPHRPAVRQCQVTVVRLRRADPILTPSITKACWALGAQASLGMAILPPTMATVRQIQGLALTKSGRRVVTHMATAATERTKTPGGRATGSRTKVRQRELLLGDDE
jgi:hypothetical protein